jgi:uncharacterized protein YciI
MTLYLALGMDKDPASGLRDRHRDEHRKYVRGNDRDIRLVGPLLDERGGQCGSMYVFETDDPATIQAWFDAEPFYRGGVYKELIVREFFVGKNALVPQDWPSLG